MFYSLYKAKEWFISHRRNFLVLAGILVVGALSFESGLLRGKTSQSEPLVISIPAVAETVAETGAASTLASPQFSGVEQVVSVTDQRKLTASCPLVGSKNSNKYHLVTCAVAKRIKPENKVCFSSKEDAEKRGYVAGCVK